jgi:LPXTG-motif cell wall-anchored protein
MRNSWTLRLITIALIGGGSISALGAISSPVSADASLSGDVTVGLDNTTANEQSCSEVPGLIGPAWHFVAPSGSFVDINFLTVGGTTYNDPDFLSYPTSLHAYVLVPAGKTIGQLEGGQFVVNGTDKVVLSHTCTGTTTTTTTTQPETTTTQPETTTTEAVSSPTTTEPSSTVSTQSASQTPTAPPTTQPPLAVELPATGSSSWTLLLAGLASALGGIGLIRISRRPA